jgi:hypothetical protein
MRVRRSLAALTVIAFAALNGTASLIRYSFDHGAVLRARGANGPPAPFDVFVQDVRSATAIGDTIVVVAPYQDAGAYAWFRFRAGYGLPGREILPILTKGPVVHKEYLRQAKYVLVWDSPVPEEVHGKVVRRGRGGVLLRNE